MPDANFDRTVVLVLAHGDEGALGVILNRPSDVTTQTALPQWQHIAADPGVVFKGGPVSARTTIGLGRIDPASLVRPEPVTGGVGIVDLSTTAMSSGVDLVRIFAGYAGWSDGQLEDEIAARGWFAVPSSPDDIFTPRPEALWRSVLRRQPARLAMLAAFPSEPVLN